MNLIKKETIDNHRTGVGTPGAVRLAVRAGALLSVPVIADRIEKETLIARSKDVSQALRAWIQTHPNSPYTTELEMVAWQMDAAVMHLERNPAGKAMSFMDRAEKGLTDLSTPLVKPILEALVSVQDETEWYERLNAMRHVNLFQSKQERGGLPMTD